MPGAPVREPVPPRAARSLLAVWAAVLAAVVALLVAVLVVVLVVLPAANRPPEAPPIGPVAEAYLDAVARGDAEEALAMTDVDEGTFHSASTALLGDDVLAGAQERIADPRVEAVEVFGYGGYAARTAVVYALGGQRHETELRWDYDEDTREWRVDNGLLATLSVAGLGGDAVPVEVAGVTPDPGAECYAGCGRTTAYVLFAGVYQVRADLSGFELHPNNTMPAELVVTMTPGVSEKVAYLAVPQGDPWPTVNGTDVTPDQAQG